jgi:GT2 family glycosyltransferase
MNSGALLDPPDAATGRPVGAAPDGPVLVERVEVDGSVDDIRDIAVATHFAAARLLVTAGGVAVGQVVVPLTGGHASAEAVRAAVHAELGQEISRAARPLPRVATPITVVVPTRGRPESLLRCLRSVLRTNHPRLTVLVVDNDPDDERTAQVVHDLDDGRVSYVRECRRGASIGRNRGLSEAAARGARFVAFVDDDVEVDPEWAGNVAAALAQPDVACVCGPVLAAELTTAAQMTADETLGWRKGFARRRFSLAEPPPESAIFPFSPGLFGVGANMAVNTEAALRIGGFDTALGPGTPTRGGEDCEFMVRLVLTGHTLTYEPSAYVWHHHRPTMAELEDQMHGYALGLGAFLTKIMLDPAGRAAALRRLPAAIRQLRRITSRETVAEAPSSSGPQKVLALAAGATAYLAARRRDIWAGEDLPALQKPPPAIPQQRNC